MGDTTEKTSAETDLLRSQVRTRIESKTQSMADISRLSGVSYSTLSAWLAGKYAGDNSRVARQIETWLGSLEAQARIQANASALRLPEFVATPSASSFIAALTHAQYVPDLVVVSGGAGVGKTTACKEYAAHNPNVWLLTAEPALGTTHGMLDYLCDRLLIHETMPNRRSRAIVSRVSNSGGLLVVDEANHLSSAALDQLRTIHDKAGVGLALVGNEEVYARLDGGGRRSQFAQLFSRVGMRVSRPRPQVQDILAMLDAIGIEGDSERRLLRAIAAKPGALRGMAKTLRIAHMLAASDGVPVTRAHLMAAWNRLSDGQQLAEAQ